MNLLIEFDKAKEISPRDRATSGQLTPHAAADRLEHREKATRCEAALCVHGWGSLSHLQTDPSRGIAIHSFVIRGGFQVNNAVK